MRLKELYWPALASVYRRLDRSSLRYTFCFKAEIAKGRQRQEESVQQAVQRGRLRHRHRHLQERTSQSAEDEVQSDQRGNSYGKVFNDQNVALQNRIFANVVSSNSRNIIEQQNQK